MGINNIADNQFASFVKESSTWTELMHKCGYTNVGNRSIVKKKIEQLNLDASHLPTSQGWSNGLKVGRISYTLNEILVENSRYTSLTALRKRLCKELNWEHRCNSCRLTEWMGKPISLEVEHKNGIHDDNRIENLEFLCPNCHALTSTYRGKNCKNKNIQPPTTQLCIECNTIITSFAKRCDRCYKKSIRKVERPSYEQLKKDIEQSNFVAVGKKYGVTDNTIRKWLRYYETDVLGR